MNFFDDCIKAIDSILEEDEYDKYYDAFNKYEKIIVLGNGGSNSLASHIAQDYTKRADKRAMSFSDPSMLTCYMNDYGVENSYMEFLKDLWQFMKERKKFWLAPLIVVLLLLGLLIVLGGSSALAPFVYTLF